MKGRRVPVTDPDAEIMELVTQPGDYYGPFVREGWYGNRPMVWFLLPVEGDVGKHPRLVCSPPHTFTEEPDGTLTIRNSIRAIGNDGEPDIWHGYLTAGEWASC